MTEQSEVSWVTTLDVQRLPNEWVTINGLSQRPTSPPLELRHSIDDEPQPAECYDSEGAVAARLTELSRAYRVLPQDLVKVYDQIGIRPPQYGPPSASPIARMHLNP
jgi:hypothetical protein